jgi:hypothetical protein
MQHMSCGLLRHHNYFESEHIVCGTADAQDVRHRGKHPDYRWVSRRNWQLISDDDHIVLPQAAIPGLSKEDIRVSLGMGCFHLECESKSAPSIPCRLSVVRRSRSMVMC